MPENQFQQIGQFLKTVLRGYHLSIQEWRFGIPDRDYFAEIYLSNMHVKRDSIYSSHTCRSTVYISCVLVGNDCSLTFLRRKAFVTTDSGLRLMAAAAIMGDSNIPKTG